MPDLTPDLAELRRLRDTEREELHSPTRRLDAYYYSFSETGSVPIDAILSAVAIAGKSCHNTDRWTEDDEWSRWGVGRSLVDVIQCAANEAAAGLLDAAAERDALRDTLEETEGRLSRLLWDLTGGQLSKPTYPVDTMVSAIEEHLGEYYESDAQAERDALAAKVERVRALHQPEVNSTSALFPTPLCGCGDAHPCATIRALDTTPDTGGES